MTIEERIASRIRELEADRDRINAALAELRLLVATESPPVVIETPAPHHERNGVPKRSAPSPDSLLVEKAVRIARLLAERGPLKSSEIMPALGMEKNGLSHGLRSRPEWFAKQGNNLSPWTLTEEGRKAVSASGASGDR